MDLITSYHPITNIIFVKKILLYSSACILFIKNLNISCLRGFLKVTKKKFKNYLRHLFIFNNKIIKT